MASPGAQRRSRIRATMRAARTPINRVSQGMRRSVTAAGGGWAAIEAIRASPQATKNVAHACIEPYSAEHEQEKRLGVQPVVQKIAEKPAHDDRGDEDERQFHGDSGLIGGILRFLLYM